MLTNILNILSEASLYLLLFGITFSNSACEIFAVSMIAFFVIGRIVRRDPKPPKTAINIPLYILCAVIFVSFCRSAFFSESVRGFIRIIKFVFLYFAVVDFFIADKRRLERAFWAIMFTASIAFANGIFQSVAGFDLMRHYGLQRGDYLRRIQGAFVHPNDFGGYITTLLPLAFCFLCRELKNRQRLFLVVSCLMGMYCLLKTSSRGAWIGFLISLAVYLFVYNKKLLVMVPAAAALLIALTPHGIERVMGLFSAEQNTVWERKMLWKGTWEMIKAHPVLGFGINTFTQYFWKFRPAEYPDLRYAHNSYLQMWAETGIIGLVAFLSTVFVVIKVTAGGLMRKAKSGSKGLILLGLFAGYTGFLFQSGIDTHLFSLRLTTLFWVVTAYIMSINKVLEGEIASPATVAMAGSQ